VLSISFVSERAVGFENSITCTREPRYTLEAMKRPASQAATARKKPATAATKKPATSATSASGPVSLKFPKNFLWGSATAAYQIEGAAFEGGRTACIWDTFCATEGKVKNGDNGSVACDHYHKFKEDVKMMKKIGLPAYRFSISWSRLLPTGRGEANPEAVKFYGSLLDELHKAGIKPLATIYHWDLPQCLEDEYGGWLDRKVPTSELASARFFGPWKPLMNCGKVGISHHFFKELMHVVSLCII